MSSQSPSLPDADLDQQEAAGSADGLDAATEPPRDNGSRFSIKSSFWQNRLFEAGLILSMTLYYVIGNANLGNTFLFHINPLFSLPFLILFAVLCWYRLPFAVALLPLTLPYYAQPKTVISHYSFSIAEITLAVCLLIAVLQLLWQRSRWPYWLSWRELRDRLGPFIVPTLVFVVVAAFSIVIAYEKAFALRAFHREVLAPLLYVVLALYCLRSRQDVLRLLGALLATGLMVALLGLIQYVFFKSTLPIESDGIRRVHAMYGSANSIGLLFDYILPIGLAWLVAKNSYKLHDWAAWKKRGVALVLCVLMLSAQYLTHSLGAWLGTAMAILFIAVLSIRSRKMLLLGIALFAGSMVVALIFFHTRIYNLIFENHLDVRNISTTTKRLYLWQTAWNMIRDNPWFGYGLDNWLCHFSLNNVCVTPHLYHYTINEDPVTHALTGLGYEPDLSHPHNIFLQIWISVGIFGLLAFAAILVLFFWLFARILMHLRANETPKNVHLQCMTVGVGAAMLAAMAQGMGDSAFLEQDLAFCFWMLVVTLLVLRVLSGTPWRGRVRVLEDGTHRQIKRWMKM